ncbi:hypothetical protein HWV62_13645 [Athelia sp. TMB]|nr:hypothetical protein HWV62_13645 [Athelia sp. TMB]
MRHNLKQAFRSRKRELATRSREQRLPSSLIDTDDPPGKVAQVKHELALKQALKQMRKKEGPSSGGHVRPSYEIVRAAATAVTQALTELGLTCAIFGSLASRIYGSERDPESVSVLVWPPTPEKYDLRRLKAQIADTDFTVFSLASKSQRAQVDQLWYCESPKDKTSHCPITLAVPGMLGLPGFSARRIAREDGLPLVPAPILLFQLLAQWEAQREAGGARERQCTFAIRDVLASPQLEALGVQRPWRELGLFSAETQRELSALVQRYSLQYPRAIAPLSRVGLPVHFSCEAAAKHIIQVLKGLGMVAAVHGSVATRLYSDSARNPKNINIFVWSLNTRHIDLESVKAQMVESDSAHFDIAPPTEPSKQRPALWYRGAPDPRHTHFRIDIRVPAMVSLPKLKPAHVVETNGILAVPFAIALIEALHIWDFECMRAGEKSGGPDCLRRADDVQRLLKSRHILTWREAMPWRGNKLFTDTYRETVEQKVRRFCAAYPDFTRDWKLLGFISAE